MLATILTGFDGAAAQQSAPKVVPSISDSIKSVGNYYSDLIARKKFAQALRDLDDRIDNDSDDALFYLWRGNVYWSICDYRNAISDFDRVIALDAEEAADKLPETVKPTEPFKQNEPDTKGENRDASKIYNHKLLTDACLHRGICLARLGDPTAPAAFAEAARNQYIATAALSAAQTRSIGKALLESGQSAELRAFIARMKTLVHDPDNLKVLNELTMGAAKPIEMLRKDSITAGLDSIIATKHFVFLSDIDEDNLQRYATIAENFWHYINDNFYKLDQTKFPVSFFILHDKPAERAFLKDRLNFPHHVHGVFISSRNVLVTYDGVGDGVFLHEIMHKLLDGIKLEYWAEEGIPSFFEKCYGAIAPHFSLSLGYPANNHPRLIESSKRELSQIVSSARHADPSDEEAQHLVALFLYRHDKLKPYLGGINRPLDRKYKSRVEAAFGMTFDKLDLLFKKYLKELSANRKTIEALPPSCIYDTIDEMPKNLQQNHLL